MCPSPAPLVRLAQAQGPPRWDQSLPHAGHLGHLAQRRGGYRQCPREGSAHRSAGLRLCFFPRWLRFRSQGRRPRGAADGVLAHPPWTQVWAGPGKAEVQGSLPPLKLSLAAPQPLLRLRLREADTSRPRGVARRVRAGSLARSARDRSQRQFPKSPRMPAPRASVQGGERCAQHVLKTARQVFCEPPWEGTESGRR